MCMLELTGKLSLDRLRDRNQPQFTITQIRVSAHPDPAAPDGTWERPAVRTDIEDFALSTLRTSAYPMWPSPAKTPAGRASTRPSPSPANSRRGQVPRRTRTPKAVTGVVGSGVEGQLADVVYSVYLCLLRLMSLTSTVVRPPPVLLRRSIRFGPQDTAFALRTTDSNSSNQ